VTSSRRAQPITRSSSTRAGTAASVVTQDLDFSAIVALSGQAAPSVISLRLASSRIERVNALLAAVLPKIEPDVAAGAIVTVDEHRVRSRGLPIA